MKIVVLDGYTLNPGDLDWKGMEAFGQVTVYDRTSLTDIQEIIDRIGDAEVVYTNKTPLPGEVFNVCSNIRFVGVLATGYNVVDTAAAKEKGIPVSNIPTYGTAAVGQFAIAMLLEICHHVAPQRCSPPGALGEQCRLVFLGLSFDRACRKNHGSDWFWPYWAGYRPHCESSWYAGDRQ